MTSDVLWKASVTNVIGAITPIEMHKHYDADVAGDLERRLINSIRSLDTRKFVRGIRLLSNESKCALREIIAES